jgi:tRNA(Ile)-lysidine synthase
LAGIRPVVEPGVVRPLLEVSRSDVLAYLRHRGWNWREDSTNEQTVFARNRIRHELLPSLSQDWNPRLPETLANMAQWARDEEDYWSAIVADLASHHFQHDGEALELDAGALTMLPLAAQRRLLRAAMERVRGDLVSVDFGHVEALRGLASSARGGGKLDLPGLEARRSFGRLRLAKPSGGKDTRPSPGGVCLEPPGTFAVPGTACQVRLRLKGTDQTNPGRADNKEGYNGKRQQALDWERLPKPLSLRIWQPGDRYQPCGHKGQKKLKSLFQEGRIAAWDRAHWPVITAPAPGHRDGSESAPQAREVVVWAHEFGPAEQFTADAHSQTVLEITALWGARNKNLEIFP